MKIAIIGCGNMGSAMAKQLSAHHTIFLYDHNRGKTESLQKLGYGKSCEKEDIPFAECDFIILAVKPQSLESVTLWLSQAPFAKRTTIVSLLTGTTLSSLQKFFPSNEIVRMMPNLAILHGEGAIALVGDISEERKKEISSAFEYLGKLYWISESKINAFTSLAGSGPAFMLTLIESMVESGIGMGLNSRESQEMTLQMIRGTCSLLENERRHPAELRWQICSPQGTTIAGMRELEKGGIRSGLIEVFIAAYERANELSKK